MHFVFFHSQKHVETRLAVGRHAGRHRHALGQEFVVRSLQPFGESVAILPEQLDHLRLGARSFFLRLHFIEEAEEIKAFQRRAALFGMNLLRHIG